MLFFFLEIPLVFYRLRTSSVILKQCGARNAAEMNEWWAAQREGLSKTYSFLCPDIWEQFGTDTMQMDQTENEDISQILKVDVANSMGNNL